MSFNQSGQVVGTQFNSGGGEIVTIVVHSIDENGVYTFTNSLTGKTNNRNAAEFIEYIAAWTIGYRVKVVINERYSY